MSPVKIWLDDLREPPDHSWLWFKEAPTLIMWLNNTGHPRFNEVEVMSLDHDLGVCRQCHGDQIPAECRHNGTGYDVLTFMESMLDWVARQGCPDIRIHTANPVARIRMQLALGNIEKRVRQVSPSKQT